MDRNRQIGAPLLVMVVAACGGGGGGGAPVDPNAQDRIGRGSLTIEDPNAAVFATERDFVTLSGSAFISPTHFRCCSGSATDSGVIVTSSTGSLVSQRVTYCQPFVFGPPALCDHTWSTTIRDLPLGDTRVTMEARDPAGNIGRDSITLRRTPDVTAPLVESTSPAAGALNVAVNTPIRVFFTERMDATSITPATFSIVDSNGNALVGTVTVAAATATLAPASGLAGFTTYTATIATTARDAAGNALAVPHSWTFRTGAAPDTTPPSVASLSPADGSSCAGSDTVVSASFSEAINASTVAPSTFNLADASTGVPVTGSVSALSPNSFVFTPSAGLAFGTRYRATLTNGLRDLAGNALVADHAWSFSTVAAGIGAWQAISLGPLPATRQNHAAVWTGTEMIVWGGFQSEPGAPDVGTGGRYRPNTNSWAPMNDANAPSGVFGAVVWTGTEMIVWRGGEPLPVGGGGRYDPVTDTWRSISTIGATARGSAMWTGSEMIVFGQGGARYDPVTDTWRTMSLPPNLLGFSRHSMVWTGSRLIVWGGVRSTDVGVGAAYDPATDTWEVLNPNAAPSPRADHSGIWTGSEMIIWGGNANGVPLNTGAIYDPQTGNWRPMSTCGAAAKSGHTTVWTGSEMLVWGGGRNSGQRYDVVTDSWRQMEVVNSPVAISGHSAVWTGSEMVIWGGRTQEGARYQP